MASFLTLGIFLPDGYRLASIHHMWDERWTVTLGTEPRIVDANGSSLGYSEFYGTGMDIDINKAAAEAIAMIDYKRTQPKKKPALPQSIVAPPAAPTRSNPKPTITLKDEDFDI